MFFPVIILLLELIPSYMYEPLRPQELLLWATYNDTEVNLLNKPNTTIYSTKYQVTNPISSL